MLPSDDVLGETGWAHPAAMARLPEVLRSLFWDHRFDALRWPEHRDFVIGRVLQAGGMDAIAWLRKTVRNTELAEWIRQREGRGLGVRQLRFWQIALDLSDADVDGWVAHARQGPWATRTHG